MTASKTSLSSILFLGFSTIWGVCFRSADNPKRLNLIRFDTVLIRFRPPAWSARGRVNIFFSSQFEAQTFMKKQTFSKFIRPEAASSGPITDRDLDLLDGILRYRFSPASQL